MEIESVVKRQPFRPFAVRLGAKGSEGKRIGKEVVTSQPETPQQPRWPELFPDQDYRFSMGLRQGAPSDFFRATGQNAKLLGARRLWLASEPGRYSAFLPGARDMLRETIALARDWQTLAEEPPIEGEDLDLCRWLGASWEPDFLLLKPGADDKPVLHGACVCFPSSWDLAEKIGRPLDFIHEVVPGLNPSLGSHISSFLQRLRPGTAWLRSNWGLSRSPELNQHPARNLPRLAPPLALEDVWLRVENQALVALPRSRGVLFGIRLEIIPLAEVKQNPESARGLERALKTMPEEVALYKNLALARGEIVRMLSTPGL